MSNTDGEITNEVFEENLTKKRERSEAFSSSSSESPVNKITKMSGLTLETLAQVLDEKLKPIHTKLDVLDTLIKENAELKKRVALQGKKIDDLETEISKLHTIARRNNLIFRNIKLKDNDDPEISLGNIVNNVLKVQGDPAIVRAFAIAQKTKKPGIFAEFRSNNTVNEILKNSLLLRQTGIVVSRDLPKTVADQENKLLAIRKGIRATNSNVKIIVRNGKMTFNDVTMEWKNDGLAMNGGGNPLNKIKDTFNVDVSHIIDKLSKENIE